MANNLMVKILLVRGGWFFGKTSTSMKQLTMKNHLYHNIKSHHLLFKRQRFFYYPNKFCTECLIEINGK